MSAPIAFVSQAERRREREEKRKAQELILRKAKDDHDRKEQKKEAHKLRGDDKWMLSSVSDRIQAEGEKLKSKKCKKEKDKKKKKKKKKEKKEKKAKQEQHDSNSDDSSSDEDAGSNEMEWVETALSKPSVQDAIPSSDEIKQTQREDWMSNPFTMATYSRDDIKREKAAQEDNAETEKEKEQKMILDNPGQSDRELNPFWKDGGSGLPEEEKRNTPAAKVGIADAGVGWLRKKYQRIVERSKTEGRSVAELAAERWGSLEKYHQLLAKAEGAAGRPLNRDRDRPRQHRDTDGGTDPRRDRGTDPRRDRDAHRDEGRYREGRDEERDHDRSSHRYSDRPVDRTQGRNRSPDRDGGRTRDRYTDRESQSSSRRDDDTKTSGRTFMRPGEPDDRPRHQDSKSGGVGSPGGLRGMFKKPGEESDDSKEDGRRRDSFPGGDRRHKDGTPSWKKKSFMRPSEGGEEISRSSSPLSASKAGSSKAASSGPTWKKQPAVKLEDPAEKSQTLEKRSRRPSSSGSSSSASGSESDSGSDAEGGRSPSPPPRILSETEMNQLGAKIVRAELMGNEGLAKKLKAQMEASRQAKANQASKAGSSAPVDKRKKDGGAPDDEKEVVLTRVDRTGQSWPLPEQSGLGSSNTEKKRKKKQNILTHDKDGQRERYFGDDDQQDLRDMVRKERMTSGEDQLRLFNKVANKALKKLTDDHTLDDMFVSEAAQRRPSGQEEERQKAAAIGQHRKMAASMSKCPYCLDSPVMQKHLIIALGIKVYLCLPATQPLTEGHCLIVPMQHTVASTALDEDVWSEIQIYRKGLTRMFEDQDRDAIFLETCMNPQGNRHMAMECIPLPKEIGDMAPIFFKKAIQESESEWSQNKKLVDTRKKDIRKSVPQGFPYFSVDFGLDGGFAHVIEDEKVFPHYFGKEIIGGMMDLEPQLWRRPHRQNFDDQRRKVLQFGEWWKPFDWTQRIGKD